MKTELIPLRERLLVQKDAGAETIGHLIVPESLRKPQNLGTVLAVGPGYFDGYGEAGEPLFQPTEYAPGDRVVMGDFAGVELVIDGARVWVLTPDEILCKVEEGGGR